MALHTTNQHSWWHHVARRGAFALFAIALLLTTLGLPRAGRAAAAVSMVKDIVPGSDTSNPMALTDVNGTLYFITEDDANGSRLWKSDGTPGGTVLVKTLLPAGSTISSPLLLNVNGTLYFAFNGNIWGGPQLWKTDGTAAGTVLIKDVNVFQMVSVGGTVLFVGADNTPDRELWKTDGTPDGTVPISSVQPDSLVNVNGTVFFAGADSIHGRELWKSDGTPGGTTLVKDIFPGSASSINVPPVNAQGTAFFTASDGTGTALWKSDGTATGTVKVKDVLAEHLTAVGGTLFFTYQTSTENALWKSDGTPDGTIFVKDPSPQPGVATQIAEIGGLTDVNGTLFMAMSTGSPPNATGSEIWKSDGTTDGTVMVKNVAPGSADGRMDNFTAVSGVLFFTVNDDVHGNELWTSDGTPDGTALVSDINPGATGSNPRQLTVTNGVLFFTADDGMHGRELWRLGQAPDTTPPTITGITWSSNPLLQGQNTTLAVAAADDASGIAQVVYTVDGGARQIMVYDPATNSWQTTFGTNLAVNTYSIAIIATDGAGNESAPSSDVLAVYNAASGYVTGHEKVTPGPGDTLPIAPDTSKKPAQIVLGFTNIRAATSTTPTSGSFDLRYVIKNKQDEFSLVSSAIDWLVVPDTLHASILGHGALDVFSGGVETMHQNVTARLDVALGTNGAPDHVTVRIYDTGVNPSTDPATWTVSEYADLSQVMIKP